MRSLRVRSELHNGKAIAHWMLGVFCSEFVLCCAAATPVFAETGPRPDDPHSRVVLANLTPEMQTFLITSSGATGEDVENELTVALEPNRTMVLRFPTPDGRRQGPHVQLRTAAQSESIDRRLIGSDLIWVSNSSSEEPPASLAAWTNRDHTWTEEETDALVDGAGFTAFPGFSAWGVMDWTTRRSVVQTIPVAVYVDEEQTASQQLWVTRLRRRIEAANEVFRKTCGIEFRIQKTGTWLSENSLKKLEDGLDDFAAKIEPREAYVAIGYSSQFGAELIGGHLGVSRGILAKHILIADTGVRMGEADHLDVLIHELGHYLGAVHVAGNQTVMFPKTRPDLVRGKRFQVGFDPLNTLILNCTAEELLQGRRSAAEFSLETMQALQGAYRIAASLPQADATARQALALVSQANDRSDSPSRGRHLPGTDSSESEDLDGTRGSQTLSPTVEAARFIIRGIVADLASQSEAGNAPRAAPARIAGVTDSDARFEWTIRQAARGAQRLPESKRPHAVAGFLIAVGVLADSTDLLLDQPVVGVVWRSVESRAERARRIELLGRVTIQGREDWAQHFAVSMALVELTGAGPAKSLGLMKEWRDSQGQSGFSFADLAADYSGVRLADALKRNIISLETLERDFTVAELVPQLATFPEGITARDLQADFGGLTGRQFSQMLERIETAIDETPVWTRPTAGASK